MFDCYDLDNPGKNAHLHRVDAYNIKREDDPAIWHSQHFFITARTCAPAQVEEYWAEHKRQKAERDEKNAQAKAEHAKQTEIGRELWAKLIPPGSTHVIIAERIHDDSDIQTDYFGEHTTKTVILAGSKHGKDLFAEMRKAALLIPETEHLGPGCDEWAIMKKAHSDNYRTWNGTYTAEDERETWTTEAEAQAELDKALAADKADNDRIPFEPFCPRLPWGGELRREAIEHREKYSMGKGYYLQARGKSWRVSKTAACDGLFSTLAARYDHLTPQRPAPTAPAPTPSATGATVTINEDKNGVEIRFPSKPAAAVLADLKAHGWRWSRFGGCWYHQRNGGTVLDYARKLAGEPAGKDESQGPDPFDMAYEDACAAACGL